VSKVHCGSAFAPGPLRNTLLLRTIRVRSQLLGRVNRGVAALVANKQTNWLCQSGSFTNKQTNKQVAQTSLLCLQWLRARISQTLGTPVLTKSYHHSGPSQMRPNKLWTRPDNGATTAKAPDRHRGRCGSVRRGRGGERYCQRGS